MVGPVGMAPDRLWASHQEVNRPTVMHEAPTAVARPIIGAIASLELPERVGNASLPEVEIVDMGTEFHEGHRTMFSRPRRWRSGRGPARPWTPAARALSARR